MQVSLTHSVQQWVMRKWRLDVEHAQCGIDLQDGLPKPLGPRFADDVLLFARTAHETLFLLENLMHEFAKVGPFLGGEKTVVLTNAAQPPSHLGTQTGVKLQVKNRSGRLVGRRGTSRTTCTLLPKPSVRIQTSCVGRYLAPGFLTNSGGCFFLSESVP